jgi:hypothetical protein
MYSAISGRFSADHLAVRDLNDSYHQEEERKQWQWETPTFESPFEPHYYVDHYPPNDNNDENEDDDDSISAQPGIGGGPRSSQHLLQKLQSNADDTPTVASTRESSASPLRPAPPQQSSFLQSYLSHTQQQQQNYIHLSDQSSLQLSALTPDTYEQQSSVGTSTMSHLPPPPYSKLSDASGRPNVHRRHTVALADGISTACGSDEDSLLDQCFSELDNSNHPLAWPSNASSLLETPWPDEPLANDAKEADEGPSSFSVSPEQDMVASSQNHRLDPTGVDQGEFDPEQPQLSVALCLHGNYYDELFH